MIRVKLKGVVYKFYDSIQEMPQKRLHEFEKHLAILSGVGNGIESFDAKLSTLYTLVQGDDKSGTIKEIENLRIGMNLFFNDFSVQCVSIGWLCSNMRIGSQEQAEKVGKHLLHKGITNEQITGIIEDVKKKYTHN